MQSELVLVLLPLLPILLVLIHKKRQIEGSKTKLPPGPPGLPIIGNLRQLGRRPHHALWELSKQYGSLMHLQLGPVPTLVVSSAKMAEEVLKTHDQTICSRPQLTSWKRLAYNFSDVALSPYTTSWGGLKKLLVTRLLNARTVESFQPLREEEVERVTSTISSLASLSKPINLTLLLQSLSNNIICRAAFGRGFNSGEQGHQENRFYGIFIESLALFTEFFVADYFPWAAWMDKLSGLQGRLERNFKELDAFYQEVIEAHVSKMPTGDEDFVDVLLRLQREDAHITEDHIKGLLMDIAIAGTDTTYTTLEYAMAELMRHPGAMLKVQEEVRSAVGKKGKVEESDVGRLRYLKAVVKETLRLHPVTPLLPPHEVMAYVNIDGYDIPPRTRVIVNVWAIGREPGSWEKPEEFIPERFVDSAVDFTGCNFQFIPFGAGRRMCPGLPFGIATVELALANLLYGFDWEVPDGMSREGIDMDERIGINVCLKTNLQLKATKYRYLDDAKRS